MLIAPAPTVLARTILASFAFYRSANAESRVQLEAATTVVSLPKGATFYREGLRAASTASRPTLGDVRARSTRHRTLPSVA